MNRLSIPNYAKNRARSALQQRQQLPVSHQYGLDKDKARQLGINSGVERAKQIIRSKSLSLNDAKRVAAFSRFKNCHTPKCQGAIDLWGGRRFINKAKSFVKKINDK